MANFLLMSGKDEQQRLNSNALKRILAELKLITSKPEDWIEVVELYEGTSAFILQLPFTLSCLHTISKHNQNKIIKTIEETKISKRIDSIVLSKGLRDISWLNQYDKCAMDGSGLYRSQTLKILEQVYSNKGIRIRDLDITIVHGDKDQHLLEIIKLLSDYAKFITIASDTKEKIEESLNSVYSETGLAIGVTKDYKRAMKNADIIINLGNLHVLIANSCINRKALIINYGNINLERVFVENTIINGMEISFPEKIKYALSDEIIRSFGEMKLAEVILKHYEEKDREEELENFRRDRGAYSGNELERKFEKLGFKIKYLKERRNHKINEAI